MKRWLLISVVLTSPQLAWSEEVDAAAALAACHALDDVGSAEAQGCYHELLNSNVDASLQAEALWRLGNLAAANRAFQRAAQEAPDDADVRARWGHLFLDAHQRADAAALFAEALVLDETHIDALLGQAELYAQRFENRAEVVISRILSLAPGNDDARLLNARLLLESERVPEARAMLMKIIEATDASRVLLAAYAMLAAADHIEGHAMPLPHEQRKASPWVAKALALHPSYADIYAVPAHFYVITRRYKEAVALLEAAVALDPEHWRAHSELGTNLLRVNRHKDARRHLEAAYAGDAFNAETVNTLRLLDSLDEFHTYTSDNLILRLAAEESAVLIPYVRELVDKLEAEMAARYGFKLERPVVLELYQHHDDFAVRTAGLPGLGILGAAFGDVVVMDGPSAKRAAEFDWYSTLWHELAHVVTLNATNNLVSRWFSEGVSVHEEQRYGPSPNASVPLDFIDAYHKDRLLPSALLDSGFMRQDYENQIGVSYVQAGLLCSYIADTYEGGLTGMLEAYRDGADTAGAIEQALGVSSGELDGGFFAHLDTRFGYIAEQLPTFHEHVRTAAQALAEERFQDAETAAAQAVALFPDFVGQSSPYLTLAKAAEETDADLEGPSPKAVSALHEYFLRGGREPGALHHLAG